MDTITAIIKNVSKDKSQQLTEKDMEMIIGGLKLVYRDENNHMYPNREDMQRSEKLRQLFTNGP